MGQVEENEDNGCVGEPSPNHFLAVDFAGEANNDGIDSEPSNRPRVGNEYQVELSSLQTEAECSQASQKTNDSDETAGVRCIDSKELPVPISWISNGVDSTKDGQEIPVPGSDSVSWIDTEIDNFLLGLYIFGKNLVRVKDFVESKSMGNVLSFYYGKFYKSSLYRRWSDCRKSKSVKCIYGQRIFTNWRQQELLSRLLPDISLENQSTLLKVTRAFNEKATSFEDFIFKLKDIVGMKAFVEAMAIGKGKRDLTGIASDHVRGNQPLSIHSEVPSGKACSSLTSGEIIKFLTGNFRLSKTRSNDLFWEAVWPRLLAKGWHSEQPNDHSYASSQHNLVFLIPGIKKFSRSKLVKGEHYFDSVSDVLGKVASDPRVLELNYDGDKVAMVDKDDSESESNSVMSQDGQADQHRPSYLRPPNHTSDLMKFTVVDTSLVLGDARFKVRELRSLPLENAHDFVCLNSSDEMGINSSSEFRDSDDASQALQEEAHRIKLDNKKRVRNTKYLDHQRQSYPSSSSLTPKKKKPKHEVNGHYPYHQNELGITGRKHERDHKENLFKSSHSSTTSKHQKLSACNHSKNACHNNFISRGHCLKKEADCQPKRLKVSATLDKESGCSKDSPNGSGLCAVTDNKVSLDTVNGVVRSAEKPKKRALIDLNEPQFPEDFGIPTSIGAVIDKHDSSKEERKPLPELRTQCPHSPEKMKQKEDVDVPLHSGTWRSAEDSQGLGTSKLMHVEPQVGGNGRRQSTRSRPLTTKALEALECKLQTTQRRGRSSRGPSFATSKSTRSSHKIAKDSASVATVNNGNVISEVSYSRAGGTDEEFSCNANNTSLLGKSDASQDVNQFAHNFLGMP